MSNHLKEIERRTEQRIELSLPITFFDQKVETKNVSSDGVYFKVITSNIGNYSLGKVFIIGIETANFMSALSGEKAEHTGFGVIVRVDEIYTTNHDIKLGVAMKFSERINMKSCERIKVYNY